MKTKIALVAGGLVAGLLCGWWLRSPARLHEPPAASLRQADGSLVVERVDPTTQPQKPPHDLPKGAIEERRVSVVVQPRKGVAVPADHFSHPVKKVDSAEAARLVASDDRPTCKPSLQVPDSCDCPPVRVDLSMVRMPDRTRRVVASSPDGQVVSGIDVPSELLSVPRIPRWTVSAVAVADLDGIRPGILITRRLGPIVVGGGLLSDPGLRRPGAIAQFGVTW